MCAMPRMNIMTSYFKISLPQKMFEKICRVICLGLTLEFAVASAGPHRKEHNSANVCVVSHDTLIPTDCTSCTGKRIHLQDFDVFLLWQYFGLRWYACLHDSFGGLHGVAVAFRACCREVLQAISAPLWGFWCVYPKIRFRAIRTALLQRCTAIPLQSQSIAMSAGVLIHFLKKHKTNQNCLNNAFSSQNTILQMDTLNSDSTLQLRSCRTVWKSDKHVHGGGGRAAQELQHSFVATLVQGTPRIFPGSRSWQLRFEFGVLWTMAIWFFKDRILLMLFDVIGHYLMLFDVVCCDCDVLSWFNTYVCYIINELLIVS